MSGGLASSPFPHCGPDCFKETKKQRRHLSKHHHPGRLLLIVRISARDDEKVRGKDSLVAL